MGCGEGAGDGQGEGKGERRRGGRRIGGRRGFGRRRRLGGRGARIFCCCFSRVMPEPRVISIQMNAEQMAQYNAYVANMTPEQRAAYDTQLMTHYNTLLTMQMFNGQQTTQAFNQPPPYTVVAGQPAMNMQHFGKPVPGAPGVPAILQDVQPTAGVAPSQPATMEPLDDDDAITLEPMVVENPPMQGVLPPPNIAQPVPVQY